MKGETPLVTRPCAYGRWFGCYTCPPYGLPQLVQHLSFRWVEHHRSILHIAELESSLPVVLNRTNTIQYAQNAENSSIDRVIEDERQNSLLFIIEAIVPSRVR